MYWIIRCFLLMMQLRFSGDGSYLLSSRILGVIPFKDVKVIPTDSTTVLVSGSTVGIYMETDGVLVIDTGEIEFLKKAVRRNRQKNYRAGRLYRCI